MKYLSQIDLLNRKVEEVRPEWWQHPYVIAAEVILAFAAGVAIAL